MHDHRIDNRLLRRVILGVVLIAALMLIVGRDQLVLSAGAASPDNATASGRSFLYVITNPNGPNEIAAYIRNPETGELILLGTYLTGGRGTGSIIDSQSPIVANAEGTRLYAVNTGSNDISVMAVLPDGALEAVGAPVPSGGVAPASLALRSDLLYVANKGDASSSPSYVGFRVASDGTLTQAKRRRLDPGDNPTQVLFSPDGRLLIGMRFGARVIDTFRVRSNSKLKNIGALENQRGPFAAVFNPTAANHLLVSDARLPGAAAYFISEQSAAVAINTVSNTPERAACWITVHRNGQAAWVANTGTNSLSMVTINSNGSLALAGTHSTVSFGRTPFEIAVDRESRFLYELNVAANNPTVHVMRVTGDAANGGLEDVYTINVPTTGTPAGLAIIEDAR